MKKSLKDHLVEYGYFPEDAEGFSSLFIVGGIELAVDSFRWADEPDDPEYHDYSGELRAVIEDWEMKTETRDSVPSKKEVAFIDTCPHCKGDLRDYMRKARLVHIERCEKRQRDQDEQDTQKSLDSINSRDAGVQPPDIQFRLNAIQKELVSRRREDWRISSPDIKAVLQVHPNARICNEGVHYWVRVRLGGESFYTRISEYRPNERMAWQSAVEWLARDKDLNPHPEQILMAGGKAASSKIPPFHLIPTVGLRRLAERFALGIERKGDKAWNAVSSNQEILSDKEFLIERLGHVIDHAMKLRDKLKMRGPFVIGDDDAGAIAWAGIYAICATEVMQWQSVQDPTVRKEHR